ncbi:hypothetical protein [Clostridium kluyveri]|uniref:Uncharacterized protein n=2 Tax=Clostridium kluyveri TaxID=1534 RepID=A0A1L5FCF8_CLOKL|nr:hypothetical protein [Clostridium kluyveri]APM40500.1 hypothetical protein BS101_18085 [Clostridium kluyveri]
MENKNEGMIKGFTQLSRAWYGEVCLRNSDYVDRVIFGLYSSQGGTTGEMTVDWINLSGKIVPELNIFSDAWSALSNFHDLINVLGEHDSEDPTPEEFCKYLLDCGFMDRTETIIGY